MTHEERLLALGLGLPSAPAPGGNYLPWRRHNDLLYLAGVISVSTDGESHTGPVRDDADLDRGRQAAELCARNLIATIREALGSLNPVVQFLTLNGYVNAVPQYGKSPSVINGASDYIINVFGESGRHARAAVAVAGLPRNATVEIQAVLVVDAGI